MAVDPDTILCLEVSLSPRLGLGAEPTRDTDEVVNISRGEGTD